MKYLLDTCIFRKLLDHFPRKGKPFEGVWEKFEAGIECGDIISVDECFNELANHYDEKIENYFWIKKRKDSFLVPTDEESIYISQIFVNPKMRENIRRKNILENRPAADAYLVAKAKAIGGTIVTVEEYKPNSAQLPNICEFMTVPCISYDNFMEKYITE